MKNTKIRIVLQNELSEIARLGRELEFFAERVGLSPRTLYELNLVLEEVVANIISYAYEDNRRHEIVVDVALQQCELSLVVEDDGRPFDPLAVVSPGTNQPLEDRPIGGLGMRFVRRFTQSIAYERDGDRNRLTMAKYAGPDSS